MVSLQAREAQAGVAQHLLRQRHGGRAGLHAAAVLAYVYFDEDAHGGTHHVQCGCQPVDALQAIHGDGNLAILGLQRPCHAGNALQFW